MGWQKLQRIILVVFLILIVGSLFFYQVSSDSINLETIRQHLKNFGIWTPLIFIIFYTLSIIFIPSTPLMIIAGILFGFKYGFIYTVIGGFTSSVIVFNLSRKLGKEWVESILEHKYLKYINEYNKRLERGAVWDLIILRITPIMPLNALNILMGVSRIKTEEYIIGTIIGLVPGNIVVVYFGNVISKIF